MNLITITIMSVILWVFIDRAKKAWETVSFGQWITSGIAVAAGLALAFSYNLDLLVSLNVVDAISIGGKIFAGLAIAGSSSVINEIIAGVKGIQNSTTE